MMLRLTYKDLEFYWLLTKHTKLVGSVINCQAIDEYERATREGYSKVIGSVPVLSVLGLEVVDNRY